MIHEWNPERDLGPDVPIGHASPGAEVYVLDERRWRTPVGAWGELYVRRPGMAQGYLHLPDDSAERFVTVDRTAVRRCIAPATVCAWSTARSCTAVGSTISSRSAVSGWSQARSKRRSWPIPTSPVPWCACGRPRMIGCSGVFGAASAPTCRASRSTTGCVRCVARSRSSHRRPRAGSVISRTSTVSSNEPGLGARASTTASTCSRAARTRPTRSTNSWRGAGGCTPSRSTTGSSPTVPRRTFGAASPTWGSPTSSPPPTR